MSDGGGTPSLRRAVLLGILQGPCELLPISSSAHLTLVPWLLERDWLEQDPELRKAVEIALHAGTALALLWAMGDEVTEALSDLTLRRAELIALSFLPAALAGLLLERTIEQRLGTPTTIAMGLLGGSAALGLADHCSGRRGHEEAGARDGLWLGVAQACALVPGISRNGATLSAARLLGFSPRDSERLSRHVALPVIAGASALKLVRLRRRGLSARSIGVLAGGAGAATVSTLVANRWLGGPDRGRRLRLYALYRSLLALGTLWRVRFRSAPASTICA